MQTKEHEKTPTMKRFRSAIPCWFVRRLPVFFSLLLLLLVGIPNWAEAQSNAPNWQQPDATGAQSSMTITAAVEFSGVFSANVNDEVGVFINGTLRGVGILIDLSLAGPTFPAGVYYSITIPSFMATPPTDQLEFRVYHSASDAILTATNMLLFTPPAVEGDFINPYVLEIGPAVDEPIDLKPLAEQHILETFPFDNIDLDTLLISTDNDPVSWTVTPIDAGVNWSINGSILSAVHDPEFIGVATARIRATEQTANMNAAEQLISYRVDSLRGAPRWAGLGPQTAESGDTFPSINLDSLVVTSTPDQCYTIDYLPVLNPELRDTFVDWQMPDPMSFLTSMTVTAEVQYTPNFTFTHPNDQLAAFIGGEIRGLALPDDTTTERIYFLTIGHNSGNPDTVEILFYSGAERAVYRYPMVVTFASQQQLGNPVSPEMLDFSPLNLSFSATNELSVEIRNPAWSGLQAYDFFVRDCTYPDLLNSKLQVPFCYAANDDVDPIIVLTDRHVTVCQRLPLELAEIVDFIDLSEGFLYSWSTTGDGSFLDANKNVTNDFREAVGYLPGPRDIEARLTMISLSLSSGNALNCNQLSEQILVEVLIVNAGTFPWDGG